MRTLLAILFISWIVYIIVIAKVTSKKYAKLLEMKSVNEDYFVSEKRKLRRQHLKKVFLGLLVVLIVVLVLVFI